MNRLTTLALLLVGCGGGDSGIWAFQLPYDDTYECTDTITHNFTEGYTLEDDTDTGAWTLDESESLSPQLFFGQVETFGDEAILIIGAEAYPGVATEGGGWNFSWTGTTDTSQNNSHDSGYSSSSSNVSDSSVSIKMNISGESATGTWSASDNADRAWTESDTWEAGIVGTGAGQIPSAQYLVYDFVEGEGKNQVVIEGAPLTNEFDTTECSGDCELSVVSSCSGSVEFTATKAGFEDEDVYEYLDQTGQPFGS